MASTLHEVFTQHNAALSFTAKDDANPSWDQICIILSTLGIADRHLMSSINCPETLTGYTISNLPLLWKVMWYIAKIKQLRWSHEKLQNNKKPQKSLLNKKNQPTQCHTHASKWDKLLVSLLVNKNPPNLLALCFIEEPLELNRITAFPVIIPET